MIIYILKSAICLTVLLVLYYVLLEKKKMHIFNRFYLLLSLVIGLVLPVLTIKIPSAALNYSPVLAKAMAVQQAPLLVTNEARENETIQQTPVPYSVETLFLMVYGLITAVFAARFAANIIKIRSQINKNPRLKVDEASLVLLSNEVVPHSFMGYVFLNEDDYRGGRIEGQLLEHEFTHVRQMHTLDILFIEILKIVFWFNPVFIFFKKAIQFNHEFLADEAVLSTYEVSAYQYLLLERTIITSPVPLTSNLNYSLTKKRLTMMIKTTSKLKIWTARIAIIPVLAALLFLFSMKSVPDVHKLKPTGFDNPAVTKDDSQNEVFFKGATIWTKNKDGKYMPKKYDDMTAAEKAALPAAPRLPTNTPTSKQFASWKTQPNVYTICINNKYADNSELAKYKPEDFVHFSIRKPGSVDKAVNKNYGRAPHLIDMLTSSLFTKEFVEPYNKPGKSLTVYKGNIRYFENISLKRAYPIRK